MPRRLDPRSATAIGRSLVATWVAIAVVAATLAATRPDHPSAARAFGVTIAALAGMAAAASIWVVVEIARHERHRRSDAELPDP
jgi:hypothetical protein